MLLTIICRLEDWEYESHFGYVSSFAKHGMLTTYADGYNSYINDTAVNVVTLLYTSEQPYSLVTAVYEDLYATYVSLDNSIHIYMNYTKLNDDDVEETIWYEIEDVRIRSANAQSINLYYNTIAYSSTKNTNFYKFTRKLTYFNQSVPSDFVLIAQTTVDYWQFFSLINGSLEMPYIAVIQNDAFYAVNITAGTSSKLQISVPYLEGQTGMTLMHCNSSEATSMLVIRLSNNTVITAYISIDYETLKLSASIVNTIDVQSSILPLVGLYSVSSFYNFSLYSLQHVLLFKMDYLVVYPLLSDGTVYYFEENAEYDYYSVLLVRLLDTDIFTLTVDKAPAFVYSDCFSRLYLMGTYDDSISGYFVIDMNGLIAPAKTQLMSCWTQSSLLNVLYDFGGGKIFVTYSSGGSCDSVPPQALVYYGFGNSQLMSKTVDLTHDTVDIEFSAILDRSPYSTYDILVSGAVGVNSANLLVSDMFLSFLTDEFSAYSCWENSDALSVELVDNLLRVTVRKQKACIYDQPRVSAVIKSGISQRVYLYRTGLASPNDDYHYFYFYDPDIETFAGDINITFYVQQIAPSGAAVGPETIIDVKKVSTSIASCWNNKSYIGMTYNFDHFELLLYNRIWQELGDEICDPRVDFDELEVKFEYKTKSKKSLTLSEKDFKVLPNGRMAYFVEFDVYEDWVSSKVHLYTENKAEPIVGDKFLLDGDYPIEFIDPESCFEFPELWSVEYDNHNQALITVDHYYWCKDAPVDEEHHLVVYALNQDPDYDGDYPYCNFTWDKANARYINQDCELEIGVVINITLYEVKNYINEHDEWEEGDVIVFTALKKVVDSHYDFTYIILVSVFGGLAIIGLIVGAVWYYVAKWQTSEPPRSTIVDERTGLLKQELPDYDQPYDTSSVKPVKRSIFSKKVHERGFDDELFATIPAPPKKQ